MISLPPGGAIGYDRDMIPRALALLCAAGAMGACGGVQTALRTRASYDLNCPRGELRIKKVDAHTMAVDGCGVERTYVESCDAVKSSPTRTCEWIADGSPRERGR